MSVVAVKDGIIAADSGCSGGNLKFGIRKLVCKDNIAVGWTGNWIDGKTFSEWYLAGANIDEPPRFHNREGHTPPVDFLALVLRPEGWEYWHEWLVPEKQEDVQLPFFAIGSGAMAALAAMHIGAGAIEAVEIASIYADGCALPVEHFTIKQAKIRAVG